MKRSTMTAKVVTGTVEWHGETCEVGYRVGAITPDSLAAMTRLASEAGDADGLNADKVGGALHELAGEVAHMVEWWDVTDDDGNRLDASVEVASSLPLSFLMAVVSAGQEAMRPPKGRG